MERSIQFCKYKFSNPKKFFSNVRKLRKTLFYGKLIWGKFLKLSKFNNLGVTVLLTFQVLQYIIPWISKSLKFTLTKWSIAFIGDINQTFINALHIAKLYTDI